MNNVPKKRWLHATIWAAVACVGVHAADKPTVSEQAPEIRLHGKQITLPITLVKYYPFLKGSVGDIEGKWMLDTGESAAMSINDHRVPLAGAAPLGSGNYGSGQSFKTHINASVKDIRVSSLFFQQATTVESHDASQLENHITADFIGWLGYRAFAGYALEIDYDAARATFIRGDLGRVLADSRIVATLHAPMGSRANIPIASGTLGNTPFQVSFDTGQNGSLFLDAKLRQRLIDKGTLVPETDGTYTVNGLAIDGWHAPKLEHIDVTDGPVPFAAAIGARGNNLITVGYALLRQYPTLWDFGKHTIYILGRH